MVPISQLEFQRETNLTQFRDIDETSKILEIGTFVIESTEIEMLCVVSFPQGVEDVLILRA